MSLSIKEKRESIWQVVGLIPSGKVATYGQIAALAGLPGNARLVGQTLKKLPQQSQLPWHRVINSQGKLSFPPGSESFMRQSSKLAKEGVSFNDKQRLSLAVYGWKP